ncbi:uncharacterized protein BYT42DRAFT_559000 [Radiomyces spectabilis]|uniref:uncharacterized protein n=1 Tax=Radiomyces spectabilis TaxID=64574 RepID=UPI00221E8DCC|nr:uncharacterized protein BYT42DRAFT_559000 [Radiomyces spectabilis]KAI8388116.1 hypothetical protein BYT42DRAFT_559000 [Radiomyces spectabilis]
MSPVPRSTPFWMRAWFVTTSLIVLWDAAYCLLRPHSMEGGKYFVFFSPYKLYGTVDKLYGPEAIEDNNGFTGAQAFMNLIEISLGLLFVRMVGNKNYTQGQANLVGFSASILTLAKTILYWLMEVFSAMEHTKHNDWMTWIFLWVIPNGIWLVVPSIISLNLGRDLFQRLEHGKTE